MFNEALRCGSPASTSELKAVFGLLPRPVTCVQYIIDTHPSKDHARVEIPCSASVVQPHSRLALKASFRASVPIAVLCM